MPAAPELGDRGRAVGRVEVLREGESQHQAQADGHVAVAAEIEVNLERVSQQPDPGVQATAATSIKDQVGQQAARIGQQDLLGQSEDEQCRSASELFERVGSLFELSGHLVEPDDRSGDQLGKHRDVTREVDRVADGGRLAPVDVDRVAHRLESVKTDSQWQRDAEKGVPLPVRNTQSGDQGVEAVHAEVEVLEEAQQREVGDY